MAGNPAAWEYPIPAGIKMAVSITPAMASFKKFANKDPGITFELGIFEDVSLGKMSFDISVVL
jgi:hypothetical protein